MNRQDRLNRTTRPSRSNRSIRQATPPALALSVRSPLFLTLSLVLPLVLTLAGCGGGDRPMGDGVTREDLPGGGTLVRYASLPDAPTHRIEADLVLGVMDGEAWEMFGDVRGVDAGSDGAIYILDFQPRLIRVFDSEGRYLRTLGGPGDGPGEITQANGILKEPGGLLWVNDHGKMRLLGLRPDGTEVLRVPFPVMGFGFAWSGQRDVKGRFWDSRTVTIGASSPGPPQPGVNEFRSRVWFHSVHPETGVRDSVFVGERSGKSFVTLTAAGSFSVQWIPHVPAAMSLVDPAGGFWSTDGDDWRVVRLDSRGDTLLVVEASVERRPVSREERDQYRQIRVERTGMEESAASELSGAIPDVRPALTRILLDDTGRLWVQRAAADQGAPLFWDVISRDGTLEASVEFATPPFSGAVLPRVRNGHVYTVSLAEEGFPVVVRAPVPF